MATRFDWERAFVDPGAALKPGYRHVLHVLAMRVDKEIFAIKPRFQPSLTDLANDMGCDRRTVMRRLNGAEGAGWIIRDRPTKYDARTKHARTRYKPRFPPGHPLAADLEADNPQPRDINPPVLGTAEKPPRGRKPHTSSESSVSSDIDVIIEAIANRTGKTIERSRAALIRDELLTKARGTVTRTASYLKRAIEREQEPSRWLPTPTPPPFKAPGNTKGE